MGAIVTGLLGGAIATALLTLAKRTGRLAELKGDGWRRLRPGWLLHGTFIGSATLALLMSYVLLSGGSSRPDAATQNIYLVVLAVSFGIGAVYAGWIAYGQRIMWKGDQVRVRNILGREGTHSLARVRAVREGELTGDCRIVFADGSRLRFSAYLHGATELASEASRHQHERRG